MKLQDDNYSCGTAALLNAIRCFDRRVSPRLVRSYANNDEDGTDEEGIISAISKLGHAGKAEKYDSFKKAFDKLYDALSLGRPCIMAVDNDGHWIVAIGMLGDDVNVKSKIIVFDSTNTKKNMKENGVHILSKRQLAQRWKNKKKEFYFIEVI